MNSRTMNPHTCNPLDRLPSCSTYCDEGDAGRLDRVRGFLNCAMIIHDHKGLLQVYWARVEEPWKAIIHSAWIAEGETEVEHLVVLPTEKHF